MIEDVEWRCAMNLSSIRDFGLGLPVRQEACGVARTSTTRGLSCSSLQSIRIPVGRLPVFLLPYTVNAMAATWITSDGGDADACCKHCHRRIPATYGRFYSWWQPISRTKAIAVAARIAGSVVMSQANRFGSHAGAVVVGRRSHAVGHGSQDAVGCRRCGRGSCAHGRSVIAGADAGCGRMADRRCREKGWTSR